MKPDSRYKCLRYTLILFTCIRLCIGLLMAILALSHLSATVSSSSSVSAESELATPDGNSYGDGNSNGYATRPTTTFDIIMNGTDERPENPVYPEAALVASVFVIALSLIGLTGLLKEHVVWIVTFGLLSIVFLVLRVYVLLRTLFLGICDVSNGCVRDELLNTAIGVVEIILTFRLAFEMKGRRVRSSSVDRSCTTGADRGLSLPTVINLSDADGGGGGGKNNANTNTDVEEFETSMSMKRTSSPTQSFLVAMDGPLSPHQRQHHAAEQMQLASGDEQRRRSSGLSSSSSSSRPAAVQLQPR